MSACVTCFVQQSHTDMLTGAPRLQGGISPATRPMTGAGRPLTGFARPGTGSNRPGTGGVEAAFQGGRPGTSRPITSGGRWGQNLSPRAPGASPLYHAGCLSCPGAIQSRTCHHMQPHQCALRLARHWPAVCALQPCRPCLSCSTANALVRTCVRLCKASLQAALQRCHWAAPLPASCLQLVGRGSTGCSTTLAGSAHCCPCLQICAPGHGLPAEHHQRLLHHC